MSIAENISVFGGEIIYDDEKENATHRWDMNDDFIEIDLSEIKKVREELPVLKNKRKDLYEIIQK